jgi:hypothetical protein
MTTQTSAATVPSCRTAGWAAIASGAIGILAVGSLITYLMLRNPSPDTGILMLRFHDAGVILQFLLVIPVAFGLQKLSRQRSPSLSQATLATGIGSLVTVVLFLLLVFPKIVADTLYMFPQGVFGVWLIVVNWRLSGLLPAWLRWLGMVVGFGLLLVGTFPLGYAIFVDPILLQIPAVDPADSPAPPMNLANTLLHQLLWIGSLMGVLTLPFWTMLLGGRLLRESRT